MRKQGNLFKGAMVTALAGAMVAGMAMTLPVRVFLSRSSHLGAATKASSSFIFLKRLLELLFSLTATTSPTVTR